MMGAQLEKFVERRQHLPLKHKLHLMAETLRNCTNLTQGNYNFYEKDAKDREKFCAMGALGFRAGITKDQLKTKPYPLVLSRYGITPEEGKYLVKTPELDQYIDRTIALENAIWWMNDFGKSFVEIADWLDNVDYKVI